MLIINIFKLKEIKNNMQKSIIILVSLSVILISLLVIQDLTKVEEPKELTKTNYEFLFKAGLIPSCSRQPIQSDKPLGYVSYGYKNYLAFQSNQIITKDFGQVCIWPVE